VISGPFGQLEDDLVVANGLHVATGVTVRLGTEEAIEARQLLFRVVQLDALQQMACFPDITTAQPLLGNAQQGTAVDGLGLGGVLEILAAERVGQPVGLAGLGHVTGFGEQVAPAYRREADARMIEPPVLLHDRLVNLTGRGRVFEIAALYLGRRQIQSQPQARQTEEFLLSRLQQRQRLLRLSLFGERLHQR